MRNSTTIVPIGTFTPDLWQRVRETALRSAERGEVIISLHSMKRHWWSALNDLAESLHAAVTPYPIRLARALPRTRALLHELGIESTWFVSDADARSGSRILIFRGAPAQTTTSGAGVDLSAGTAGAPATIAQPH